MRGIHRFMFWGWLSRLALLRHFRTEARHLFPEVTGLTREDYVTRAHQRLDELMNQAWPKDTSHD